MKSVEEVPAEDAVVVEEGEQTNMRQVWLFVLAVRIDVWTSLCSLAARWMLFEKWLFTRHWER